jgi:hypothetical protein
VRGRATILGASVVALAAACGGGGGGKLSHDGFVKKANAICADYNKRIAALPSPSTFSDIVTYAQKARAIAQEDVGKFEKLNPPDADRANWRAFGQKGEAIISSSRQLESAAKKQDAAAIQQLLAQSQTRAAQSKRIANAMGTAECAKT